METPLSDESFSYVITERTVEDVRDNGWNEPNTKTVMTWKNKCEDLIFIYDNAMHTYKKRVERLSLIVFTLNILMSTVSLTQLGFSDTNETVEYIQKFVLLLFSTFATIASGILKMLKWQDKVEIYKKYTEKLEGFGAIVISETTLPESLRKPAIDFIIQHKNTFFEIVRSAPEIESKYVRKSNCQNDS